MPKGIRIGEEMKERVADMTLEGKTQSDISQQLGISKASISRIQREMCVSPLYNNEGGAHARYFRNVKNDKHEEPKEEQWIIMNNKTVELVGIGTTFVYTGSTKGKTLTVDMHYSAPFEIDVKDIANFANELISVASAIEKMRKGV